MRRPFGLAFACAAQVLQPFKDWDGFVKASVDSLGRVFVESLKHRLISSDVDDDPACGFVHGVYPPVFGAALCRTMG